MDRDAMQKLVAWKDARKRKPLLVQGARQVGKTWLIREFGRRHFENTAYVSFADNEDLARVFEGSLRPQRLLDAVSIEAGTPIDPATTLVVFDEIQACPRAIESLKAFNEQLPELALIGAGSLLGLALHRGTSFPVGKVYWLNMYPMTYGEFLRATGNESLVSLLASQDFSLIDSFRERYIDALRSYYFVGGMPEAVEEFAASRDYQAVRTIQQDLLTDYEHDFSKYAEPQETERIRLVWGSIPGQLARENRKFVYSAVKPSGRARDFEMAIQWLVDAGLALRVSRVTKPGIPLEAYEDFGAFKLFMLDTGLLGARSSLNPKTLLEGNRLFEEFKGALTEQYVCQTMVACGMRPWYWSASNSSGEIDFLFERDGVPVPVEVKAEENLRAKSLRAFCGKYSIPRAIRTSMAPYRQEEWLTNLPLYAAELLGPVAM